MWTRAAGLMLLLGLTGCGRGTSEIDRIPEAAGSALQGAPEFAGCQWGEVTGAGLAIKAFTCGPEQANARLAVDPALPGFWLETVGREGPARRLAVRAFSKSAKEPVQSILRAVRRGSPGPLTASCVLSPIPVADPAQGDRYVLEPARRDKPRWEASVMSDAPMAAPCGPLGVSTTGERYFQALSPTAVAFVELGGEVQIYDPTTLRTVP